MLFYFSGTGNTKHVVDKLKYPDEKVINIEDIDVKKTGRIEVDEDRLGILAPTYAAGLPTIMKIFLEKADFIFGEKPYIFFITTCDGMPGITGNMVNDILKEKGIELDASYFINMPENFAPMFNVSDKKLNDEINKKADEKIEDIKKIIDAKEHGNNIGTVIGKTAAKTMYESFLNSRKTHKFKVNDMCIMCGACERNCPIGAIELHFGVPEWVKKQCLLCMRCLNFCPTNAIEYGDSKGNGQYLHPDLLEEE